MVDGVGLRSFREASPDDNQTFFGGFLCRRSSWCILLCPSCFPAPLGCDAVVSATSHHPKADWFPVTVRSASVPSSLLGVPSLPPFSFLLLLLYSPPALSPPLVVRSIVQYSFRLFLPPLLTPSPPLLHVPTSHSSSRDVYFKGQTIRGIADHKVSRDLARIELPRD